MGKWQMLYLRTRYRTKLGWFFWFGPIHLTIRRNLAIAQLLRFQRHREEGRADDDALAGVEDVYDGPGVGLVDLDGGVLLGRGRPYDTIKDQFDYSITLLFQLHAVFFYKRQWKNSTSYASKKIGIFN